MALTTETFIQRAREIQGDIYDYSKVEYVNLKTSVCIICPEHGEFHIEPNAHLKGYKCPKCEQLESKALRKLSSFFNKYREGLPSSYVSIDFETLRSQYVSACSVGLVKYRDGQIIERYYSLIKPPKDYPEKKGEVQTNIHHFVESQFETERTMEEILPEIEMFVDGLPMVAHHATTERSCIRDTASFYNLYTDIDQNILYDTEDISHIVEILDGFLISGDKSHTLDTVCLRFGIAEEQHHHALYDAEACGDLFALFIEKLKKESSIKLPLHEIIYEKQKKEEYRNNKYRIEDKKQLEDWEQVPDNYFKNKCVCFTGFDEEVSQDYGHRVHLLGAKKLQEDNNKKTDVLICGDKNPGPCKLKRAHEYGTVILNEEDFLKILKNNE